MPVNDVQPFLAMQRASMAAGIQAVPIVQSERRVAARLHLDKIGVKLTTLSKKQSEYVNIPAAGPFKPDTYRY